MLLGCVMFVAQTDICVKCVDTWVVGVTGEGTELRFVVP